MPRKSTSPTIEQTMIAYLRSVSLARSENTARSYRNVLSFFSQVLSVHHLPPNETPVHQLAEDAIAWLATALKDYTAATEQLYLAAARGFYEYLAAERLTKINLPRLNLLIRQRSRRPGQRLPQFHQNAIATIIEHINNTAQYNATNEQETITRLARSSLLINAGRHWPARSRGLHAAPR